MRRDGREGGERRGGGEGMVLDKRRDRGRKNDLE